MPLARILTLLIMWARRDKPTPPEAVLWIPINVAVWLLGIA
jgi:hypothetical protein